MINGWMDGANQVKTQKIWKYVDNRKKHHWVLKCGGKFLGHPTVEAAVTDSTPNDILNKENVEAHCKIL